jgi:hypothetical protein
MKKEKLIVGKKYLFEGVEVEFLGRSRFTGTEFIRGSIPFPYIRNNGHYPDFPDDAVGFAHGFLIDVLEEIN